MNLVAKRWRIAALVGAGLAAAATVPAAAQSSPGVKGTEHVLVTGQAGEMNAVDRAVVAAGGKDVTKLAVIDGVSAVIPRAAVSTLQATKGVRSVTPDAHGHLMSIDPSLGYDPTNDEGSLYNIAQITNAVSAWKQGVTGKGVDVALIDSGVAPVKGLTSGNVVNGPDLSFESQNPSLTYLDTYGHGTHMASIIAGRDSLPPTAPAATSLVSTAVNTATSALSAVTGTSASSSTSSLTDGQYYANLNNHQFDGIAPDSRIISLKVASADGGADVSQVIAAIDWVTEHAQSNGLNIKVLNLSYGTDSNQPTTLDPLDYAVENAWKAGITVVVSAGNDGTNMNRLDDPANDPLVIAVGADDPQNTDSVADDVPASFSQLGTPSRHIDLLAPGVHVLGLRDPGSYIDQNNPSAVVGTRFFRGSGTSQATAVVSGIAALYLSKYPNATPDQVKAVLTSTDQVPNIVKKYGYSVGVPDINAALKVAPPTHGYQQPATGSTGTGSLEAARGSYHVETNGVTLTGEQDIFSQPWNGSSWATASANGTAWNGGTYNGSSWTGSSWAGSSWAGSSWAGSSWAGNDWSGSSWADHVWDGNTWTGSSWAGSSWAGSSWAGSSWAGSSWAGSSWAGSSWAGSSWS